MPVNKAAVEVGVIGAVGEFLIFNHFMPPVIDVRANQPYDGEIEKSERTALLVGTAFLVLLSAFTAKVETFAIVGGALVAIDYAYKHANAVHPGTGTMQGQMGEDQSLYAVPDYETADGTG
jgi:hypothetical protein